MCIIMPLARSVKAYLRRYGDRGPCLSLTCSGCGERMRRHGRFWRWCFTARHKARIPIYRWRCPKCSHTCTVLPDFLRPYARFVNWVREAVIRRRLRCRSPWVELVQRASNAEVSWLSEKTLRRWIRKSRELAGGWGQVLAQWVLELWSATDLYALAPRREGPDAALHFLLDVGDWCLRQLERQPLEHPGLFALLNRLGGGPYPL
jgi:hypothetical protein